MKTTCRLLQDDARSLTAIADDSVHLIVTSPPYPMVAMWDGVFGGLDPEIGAAIECGEGKAAFELMHRQLDRAWDACRRVLVSGGIAVINVGDATRTIAGEFCLYPNHARIVQAMLRCGMTPLPDVLWRKPTNAPNKFLGSGMLPAGAYVTYEHEYLLIFRKGGKRRFESDEDRERRRRSAFFWEERNAWFSDVWLDIRGASQELGDAELRERSAAFPFELPYRLILMHSLIGDCVLDPFAGTGTTLLAAAACGRNALGCEIDAGLSARFADALRLLPKLAADRARARLEAHAEFVRSRRAEGSTFAHRHSRLGVPVITGQETAIELVWPRSVRERAPRDFEVDFDDDRTLETRFEQTELPLG